MADRRGRSIFVNCPFDVAYKPLFDAIVFTAAYCKFGVRSALKVSDAGELRLAKIVRLIKESRFSIHDISRIELDAGLPRFNMPIELGIAIGARHFGERGIGDHQMLVLDSERYRYQRVASDLAGIDIHAHADRIEGVIAGVRDFLATHDDRSLPGTAAVQSALSDFEATLPGMAAAARQSPDEITYVDRMRHLETYLGGLA